MGDPDGSIYWYDPNPRAVIPLDERFHVPRSLARRIRQGGFEVRFNSAFRQVMLACAEPDNGRETTWITDDIVDAYCTLHQLGFAHSVETWIEGELVGGLYGVTVGGLFAGESMFRSDRCQQDCPTSRGTSGRWLCLLTYDRAFAPLGTLRFHGGVKNVCMRRWRSPHFSEPECQIYRQMASQRGYHPCGPHAANRGRTAHYPDTTHA
jgi:hypothetical protein